MTVETPFEDWEHEKKKLIRNMFYTFGKNFHYEEVQEQAKMYLEYLDFYKPEIVKDAIESACEENQESEYNRSKMPVPHHIKKHCRLLQTDIDNREPEEEKPLNLEPSNFVEELEKEHGKPEEE